MTDFLFGHSAFQRTKGTIFPLGSAVKNKSCLKYFKYQVEKNSDDGTNV